MARYVVEAVLVEGRSVRAVAAAHGVSKSWVAELVRRFKVGGYPAIQPRSKAPRSNPRRIGADLEERIVELRKDLTDRGFDAGAQTIHYHLELERQDLPSVPTIWRILRRRGFVTPHPQKRPRSSWIRFEAQLPNECWQSDFTYWRLADGTEAKILNFIDDHSRLIVASRAFCVLQAADVLRTFHRAAKTWGFPASVLTDNGAVYTAASRGGSCAMETELLALGITYKHSRPYHPQTMGKVERFHQTLKTNLAKQPAPATIRQLQTQIDRFVAYYNNIRPHRARDRMTPHRAFQARAKAVPIKPSIIVEGTMRVRRDTIDYHGVITLRHRSRLHHIGIGRDHKHKRVLLLVDGLDVRVLTEDGELLRQLTLDPTKDYQPTGRKRGPARIPPSVSTMS